uniref:Putative secreted protein n=1 Tax=Anopheles marajoara TaxID=58244 RepID=A0A2M4C918_9DIPT
MVLISILRLQSSAWSAPWSTPAPALLPYNCRKKDPHNCGSAHGEQPSKRHAMLVAVVDRRLPAKCVTRGVRAEVGVQRLNIVLRREGSYTLLVMYPP